MVDVFADPNILKSTWIIFQLYYDDSGKECCSNGFGFSTKEGTILTNHHCVSGKGAKIVAQNTSSDKAYNMKISKSQISYDAAELEFVINRPHEWHYIPFADSGELTALEYVGAIGCPSQSGYSVMGRVVESCQDLAVKDIIEYAGDLEKINYRTIGNLGRKIYPCHGHST